MIHNDGGYPPNINLLDTGIEDKDLADDYDDEGDEEMTLNSMDRF